jgi:nitroreductase
LGKLVSGHGYLIEYYERGDTVKENMGLIDIIKNRRSVRKYSSRQVEREKIINMVEAARLAPSASNGQPWRFFAVSSREKLDRLVDSTGFINNWTKTAPLIIVACSTGGTVSNFIGKTVKGIRYDLLDLGIATEHIVLTAAEQGLSTCWIGWFDERRIKRILDIPRNLEVVSLLTVGYAEEGFKPGVKKRLSLDEILFFK